MVEIEWPKYKHELCIICKTDTKYKLRIHYLNLQELPLHVILSLYLSKRMTNSTFQSFYKTIYPNPHSHFFCFYSFYKEHKGWTRKRILNDSIYYIPNSIAINFGINTHSRGSLSTLPLELFWFSVPQSPFINYIYSVSSFTVLSIPYGPLTGR